MNNSLDASGNTFEFGKWFREFLRSKGNVFIFLIIWLSAILFVKNFATLDNNLMIIKQSSALIIASLGMTFVLITGGIDLSIGYIVGMASITTGILIKVLQVPVVPSILIVILIGALCGICNGFLVQVIKVPSFIATLGSGYIIFGIAQIVSKGMEINSFPIGFLVFGKAELFGIPSSVYIVIILMFVCYLLLHRSIYGRSLSALGFNAQASYLSGIKTGKMNFLAYVINGGFAALAGILLTIRVNAAQPSLGGSVFTFEVITAVILGGASLFGGKGSVQGAVLGVLIIMIIQNCINLLGVPYFMYQAALGIVILCAIIFENIKNRSI